MLNSRALDLKTLTKLGTVVAMMIAASACSHEQLKDEAEVSAIADQSADASFDNPTPDLNAPATPVPTDESLQTPVAAPAARHHKASKHAKHHPKKKNKKISKHRRHKKTMVAAAGQVTQAPPTPPTDASTVASTDAQAITDASLEVPAPPVPTEVVTESLTSTDDDSNYLPVLLILGGLGALTFAGYRLRKVRGSRRLVFN